MFCYICGTYLNERDEATFCDALHAYCSIKCARDPRGVAALASTADPDAETEAIPAPTAAATVRPAHPVG